MQKEIKSDFHSDLKAFFLEQLSRDYLVNKYGIEKRFPEDKKLLNLDYFELIKIFMHFKARLIHGKKTVYISAELQSSSIYKKYQNRVEKIKSIIESGQPVREYLSDKIENLTFKDKLFEDWGILHLHLFETNERLNNPEDNWLIYLIKDSDKVFFIDIQNHQSFFETALLEIIDSNIINAPGFVNSIKPDNLGKPIHKILRNKNVGYTVNINGKSFMTRMNKVMIDGVFCSRFVFLVDSLSISVLNNYDELVSALKNEIGTEIQPEFHIGFDNKKQELVLFDASSKTEIDANFSELIQLKDMVHTNDFFV